MSQEHMDFLYAILGADFMGWIYTRMMRISATKWDWAYIHHLSDEEGFLSHMQQPVLLRGIYELSHFLCEDLISSSNCILEKLLS